MSVIVEVVSWPVWAGLAAAWLLLVGSFFHIHKALVDFLILEIDPPTVEFITEDASESERMNEGVAELMAERKQLARRNILGFLVIGVLPVAVLTALKHRRPLASAEGTSD